MGITYGDHLIDSGYYDITPEQEREIEEWRMTDAKHETEVFIFFREGMFYPVEISRNQVLANVELNPGTLKVEDMRGNIVWRPR